MESPRLLLTLTLANNADEAVEVTEVLDDNGKGAAAKAFVMIVEGRDWSGDEIAGRSEFVESLEDWDDTAGGLV